MTTGVLCAVRGPREPSIVAALDARTSVLRVVRRCADVAELLAATGAGLGRIVVLSGDLPELDRETLFRFRASGALVLAIVDPHSDWQAERMEALGATLVVSDDRTAEEIADAAEDLHGLVGHLERGHRGVALAQCALALERHVVVEHPRGLVDEAADVLELNRHVGELELDELEVADRLTELVALRGVGRGVFEGGLGETE